MFDFYGIGPFLIGVVFLQFLLVWATGRKTKELQQVIDEHASRLDDHRDAIFAESCKGSTRSTEPDEPTCLQILSDQFGDKRPEEMTKSELVTLCNALTQ